MSKLYLTLVLFLFGSVIGGSPLDALRVSLPVVNKLYSVIREIFIKFLQMEGELSN